MPRLETEILTVDWKPRNIGTTTRRSHRVADSSDGHIKTVIMMGEVHLQLDTFNRDFQCRHRPWSRCNGEAIPSTQEVTVSSSVHTCVFLLWTTFKHSPLASVQVIFQVAPSQDKTNCLLHDLDIWLGRSCQPHAVATQPPNYTRSPSPRDPRPLQLPGSRPHAVDLESVRCR